MRKLMLSVVAFAVAIATSCQSGVSELDTPIGENSIVSFSVGAPELATRAFSDGSTATVLQYAVYNAEGKELTDLTVKNGEIHGSTTVNLQLTTGNTYSVIFYAAAPDAPYTVDFDSKTLSVDYSNVVSNNESYDAFYKYHTFTVTGGAQTEVIELKRPFAQLNIGTNDFEASKKAGYTPAYSYVKVPVYSKLSLVDTNDTWADVIGEVTTVEFALNDIPASTEKFPVDGYQYLSMNYLLVAADKGLVDVEFGYCDTKDSVDRTVTVGSVPLQRNYRTNLYGQVLTGDVNFNVVIEPNYNDPDYEADPLQLAAAIGGEVTLTGDVVLTEPLYVQSSAIINLDGNKLTGSVVVAQGVSLTVSDGTIENTDDSVSAITSNGNLVLNDVQISSARHAVRIESGSAIIDGGTYQVVPTSNKTLYALNIGDDNTTANVTIKDGTFIGPKGTQADSGAAVTVKAGSTVKIEGGNYSKGKNNTLTSKGTMIITGGTFDQQPKAEWIADGYSVIANEDSTYTVRGIDAANKVITINSAEELLYLNELNANWAALFSNGQGTSFSDYAQTNGGKGTNYYYKWGWTVKLNADIDLEDVTLSSPIKLDGWGSFDGQGHTIKNVNITTATDVQTAAALFLSNSCAIKNLVIDDVHVKGSLVGNSTAGILTSDVNKSVSNIKISNSSVWGGKYTGGVVGYGYTNVNDCSLTNCTIKGGYKLGGVIGYICAENGILRTVDGNTLTNCTVSGTDGQYAGGKSQYIIGKIVGNYNADGSCANNTVDNMTTDASSDIGEIEAGHSVKGYSVDVATAEALQAALDSVSESVTINLMPNVDYGIVDLGRPTATNNTTMVSGDFTTKDVAAFKEYLADGAWHPVPDYTTTLKDITIVGAAGAKIAGLTASSGHFVGPVYDHVLDKEYTVGSAYYSTLYIDNVVFEGVTFTGKVNICTSDADSVFDGVHFSNCSFTTGGTESSNGAAIRYYNESNNGNVKNITVKGCTFSNCYQGVYVHHVSDIAVENCKFDTTGHNAIGIQNHHGAVDLKTLVINNNSFKGIGDRVIRFGDVGANSNITIQGNTATNSGDEDGEVMKATSIEAGVTTSISGNNWGGTVVNTELQDK